LRKATISYKDMLDDEQQSKMTEIARELQERNPDVRFVFAPGPNMSDSIVVYHPFCIYANVPADNVVLPDDMLANDTEDDLVLSNNVTRQLLVDSDNKNILTASTMVFSKALTERSVLYDAEKEDEKVKNIKAIQNEESFFVTNKLPDMKYSKDSILVDFARPLILTQIATKDDLKNDSVYNRLRGYDYDDIKFLTDYSSHTNWVVQAMDGKEYVVSKDTGCLIDDEVVLNKVKMSRIMDKTYRELEEQYIEKGVSWSEFFKIPNKVYTTLLHVYYNNDALNMKQVDNIINNFTFLNNSSDKKYREIAKHYMELLVDTPENLQIVESFLSNAQKLGELKKYDCSPIIFEQVSMERQRSNAKYCKEKLDFDFEDLAYLHESYFSVKDKNGKEVLVDRVTKEVLDNPKIVTGKHMAEMWVSTIKELNSDKKPTEVYSIVWESFSNYWWENVVSLVHKYPNATNEEKLQILKKNNVEQDVISIAENILFDKQKSEILREFTELMENEEVFDDENDETASVGVYK